MVKTRKNVQPFLHPEKFYPPGVGEDYWYAPDGVSYDEFVTEALRKYFTIPPFYSFFHTNLELEFFRWYLAPFHHSLSNESLILNSVFEAFYERPLTGADAEPLWRHKYTDKRSACVQGGDLDIADKIWNGKLDFESCWKNQAFVASVMHKEEPLPSRKTTARGLGIRSTIEHILEIMFVSKLFDRFKAKNASNSQFPWVFGADISSSANIFFQRLTDIVVCSDLKHQDKCHYPHDFRFYHDILYELLGLHSYPKHIRKLFKSLVDHAAITLFRTDWGKVYLKTSGLVSGDLFTLFLNCLMHILLYVRYLLRIGWSFERIAAYLSRALVLGDDAGRTPMDNEKAFYNFLMSIGIHMETSEPMPKKDATFIGHKFVLLKNDFDGNELMFPHAVLAPESYDKLKTNSNRAARNDSVQMTYDHLIGQLHAASADNEMRPKLQAYANDLAARYPFVRKQPLTTTDLNRGHGLSVAFRKVGHFN